MMLKASHKRSLKHFDLFWSKNHGWLGEVTTLGNIDGMGCGTAVTQLHSKVVVQKAAAVVAIWLADDYSIMFAKPFFVVKRLWIVSQAILLNHFETDGMAGMDSYGNSLVGVSFSRAD